MTQSDPIVHAAIDVSKTHLDLYCPEIGTRRFTNTPKGIRDLMRLLAGKAVTRIEMEATGGYERALKRSAWESGLEVCLVNALRVRQFARAQGLLAKTDQIDAKLRQLIDTAAAPQERGKAPKVALTACMRGMIVEINASVRDLSASPA